MNLFTSRLCRKAFPMLASRSALTAPTSLGRLRPPVQVVAQRYLSDTPDTKKEQGISSSPKDAANSTVTSLEDLPGVKTEGEKYVIIYTCKVCDHRSGQKISKQGYHNGAVVVRCPNCANLHLIADNLGIFEDKGWNVEQFMKEKGENFNTIRTDDILEFIQK